MLKRSFPAAATPEQHGTRRCYKVKLGPDYQVWLPRLQRWRQINPLPTALRLDFNRSLGAHEWYAALDKLACLSPEFVEEPCPSSALGTPRDLPAKLAFDESLWSPQMGGRQELDPWLASGQVAALVLKPMALGHITHFLQWAQHAQRYSLGIVLSHLFDGNVAASMYEQLARAFGSLDRATGLGEHPGLSLWGTRPPVLDQTRAQP
jgi:L-alanine-DL-glutamate epimerase-like enolase superfamily enzyme